MNRREVSEGLKRTRITVKGEFESCYPEVIRLTSAIINLRISLDVIDRQR